ncbi:hypothetical protein C4565_07530 [Candidatus Parcubacteria bacterium]|jgi:hypothetical protein|nr:MAG: hypothetical protein C4565_07530 [Candidatus Parcubacteria bacterium]
MKYKSFIIFIIIILTFFVGEFVSAQYITIDQNTSSIENTGAVLKLNERSGNDIIFGSNDLFVINSTGNIGIYTSNPSYKLQVTGKGYFSSPVFVGSPTGVTHAVTKSYVDSMVGGGIASGTSGQTLRHSGSSWVATSLLFNNGTNVGIGTTNPTYPFHLYNLAPPSGVLATFETGGSSGSIRLLSTGSSWELVSAGSALHFYNNNTSAYRLTMTNAGNIGIGTTTPAYTLDVVGAGQFDGAVIVGSPTAVGHVATKSYADSSAYSLWNASGSNLYSINTGNVGIGTSTPTAKLDVYGTIKMNGFQLGTSATPGYVLTVDASGNGTWQIYNAQVVALGASDNVMYLRSGSSDPRSFTWQLVNNYSPDTYITCPEGYTKWWSSNAYYSSSESGYVAYTGACYPTSASNDLFKWRSPSPSSVTCPTGYTRWVNTWWDVDPDNSTSKYDGVCYKGTTLPSFSWSAYTASTQTCPTGLTNWYDNSYARWRPAWYEYCVDEPTCSQYDYTYDYWSYSGACYNASATNDVFTWKSYSGATSVTCPTGYTRWVGQYVYSPAGIDQVYSGACYKGNPPSFIWESYTGLGNPTSVVSCPSGFTNWSNTSAVYYNAPISGYQAYTGACINNTNSGVSDTFVYNANAASNSITCPTGYTKYTNQNYTRKRYSSQTTYDSACYKIISSPAPSCPSGWSSAPTSTVTIDGVDVNEQICYRTDAPFQSFTLRAKGANQSLSCPAGWGMATSTQNIGSNTELVCYAASCPNGLSAPSAPTGATATPGALSNTISWTAPTGNSCALAYSYNVYRSTTSGSGYSLLTSNVTSTSYVDSGLSVMAYYYKVSSVNPAGESGLSSEVTATPTNPITVTFNNITTGRTGSLQTFTASTTGSYIIEAWGAQGGSGTGSNSLTGGLGAYVKGTVSLTAGDVIKILVGQQGGSNGGAHGNENGGGGGTFVVKQTGNVPLIIAGGGGGGPATSYGTSCTRTASEGNGQSGTSGVTISCAGTGTGGSAGSGGSSNQSYAGGAGGGFSTNGMDGGTHCATAYGGQSYLNGGAGGTGNSCYTTENYGGYGGGGGGQLGGPGAGGGYSGGGTSASWSGSSTYGGGGGSYNSGTNQTNTAGVRSGHGMVKITY